MRYSREPRPKGAAIRSLKKIKTEQIVLRQSLRLEKAQTRKRILVKAGRPKYPTEAATHYKRKIWRKKIGATPMAPIFVCFEWRAI